jgi:uncharacterized FlaG/YvyC family protein
MSDITLTPLTKPISPSVNQQQPKKPYQPPVNNAQEDGTINLVSKETEKIGNYSDLSLLPQKREKIDDLEFKERETFQKSQKLFYKEKELAVKRSELPFVKDEKVREKLESDIYHLNLKLEELKKSENGPKIDGAQFRLNEDDDGFYVELINVEQDVVIKELSEENFEEILKQTSDPNNLGVLLDLFA